MFQENLKSTADESVKPKPKKKVSLKLDLKPEEEKTPNVHPLEEENLEENGEIEGKQKVDDSLDNP